MYRKNSILKTLSIFSIKTAPLLLVLIILAFLIVNYFTFDFIISLYIVLPLIFLLLVQIFILSLTFKFCIHHRLLIYYAFIVLLLYGFECISGFNLFNFLLVKILLIIGGITVIVGIITYLFQK